MSLLCYKYSQHPTSPALKPKPLREPTSPAQFTHCLSDLTFSCSPSWLGYTSLFAIPRTYQICFYLRAFTPAIPTAWKSLPQVSLWLSPHRLPFFTVTSPCHQGVPLPPYFILQPSLALRIPFLGFMLFP